MAGICSIHKENNPDCNMCRTSIEEVFPNHEAMIADASSEGTLACPFCNFKGIYAKTTRVGDGNRCPLCETVFTAEDTTNRDIFDKLLVYHLGLDNMRGIDWIIKRIEQYYSNFKGSYRDKPCFFKNSVSPEDAAAQIVKFFEDEDKKKEEEKAAKQKIERAKRDERSATLYKRISETPIVKSKPQSLEFQLGLYIGDYIVSHNLPCLSIDDNTNKVIQVSEEETAEYNKLVEQLGIDREAGLKGKESWNKYIEYRTMLKNKYLPPILDCYVYPLSSVDNMEKLISGIEASLWNSDVCSYEGKIEVIIGEGRGNGTIVNLHLNKNGK